MQFFTFRNTLASNRIEASFECKYADQLLRFNGCIKLIQIYIQRGPAHDSRARPIHHCYHYYHHRVSRFTPRGCGFIIRRERETWTKETTIRIVFSREGEARKRGTRGHDSPSSIMLAPIFAQFPGGWTEKGSPLHLCDSQQSWEKSVGLDQTLMEQLTLQRLSKALSSMSTRTPLDSPHTKMQSTE